MSTERTFFISPETVANYQRHPFIESALWKAEILRERYRQSAGEWALELHLGLVTDADSVERSYGISEGFRLAIELIKETEKGGPVHLEHYRKVICANHPDSPEPDPSHPSHPVLYPPLPMSSDLETTPPPVDPTPPPPRWRSASFMVSDAGDLAKAASLYAPASRATFLEILIECLREQIQS